MALMSGGSGLIGGIYQGWVDSYQMKKQDSYNRAAADRQDERSKDAVDLAWERETAYNAPLAQMARFKEAGLNPNLIYGTGSASAGNTHASVANVATQKPRDASNFASSTVDGILKTLSLKNLELQNDIAQRTGKNLEVKNMQDMEVLTGLRRENKILQGSGASSKDPWYIRQGGRVGQLIKEKMRDIRESPYKLDPSKNDIYSAPRA